MAQQMLIREPWQAGRAKINANFAELYETSGGESATGPAGPQGERGEKGETGDIGPIGLTGDVGPKGDKGDPGDDGANGLDGSPGIAGIDGTPGAKGDTGDIGPQGPIGQTGAQGIQGVAGQAGSQGIQGIQGATGLTGLTGPAGVDGVRTATTVFGYATGAGGTVTQATNKSTAVTLNTLTGQITMNAASMAAAAIVTFTLNNSTLVAGDQLVCTHHATGTFGPYGIAARVTGNGAGAISVRNNSAAALAEAIVLKFSVIRAVTA